MFTKQLQAALLDIHEIFFEIPVQEKMALIAHSRQLMEEKRLRDSVRNFQNNLYFYFHGSLYYMYCCAGLNSVNVQYRNLPAVPLLCDLPAVFLKPLERIIIETKVLFQNLFKVKIVGRKTLYQEKSYFDYDIKDKMCNLFITYCKYSILCVVMDIFFTSLLIVFSIFLEHC